MVIRHLASVSIDRFVMSSNLNRWMKWFLTWQIRKTYEINLITLRKWSISPDFISSKLQRYTVKVAIKCSAIIKVRVRQERIQRMGREGAKGGGGDNSWESFDHQNRRVPGGVFLILIKSEMKHNLILIIGLIGWSGTIGKHILKTKRYWKCFLKGV